jgi:hypothetical protein
MADKSNYIQDYLQKNNLKTKTNFAPQGVIFISNRKAFVGMDHGHLPLISEDLLNKLILIANKNLYYEGLKGGPDAKLTEPLFGKYDDGFDYVMTRSIVGHPPEFLYALFSNNPPESISDYITNPTKSIFDAMVNAGFKISSMKKNKPTARTVESFLTSISDRRKKIDFLKIAKETKATPQNAINFIRMGAAEMWPANWESYPNPAGKIAKKANDYRDIWVTRNGPDGLYTIGSGHLLAISKISGKPIIDGKDIQR